jgi:hypothetical protein
MTPKSEEEIFKQFSEYHPVDMIISGAKSGVLSVVKRGVEILSKKTNQVPEILETNLQNHYFVKIAEKGYLDIMEYLLQQGFIPSRNNVKYIASICSYEMVELLMKYGCEVDDYLINHVERYRGMKQDFEKVMRLLQKHNKDRFVNKIKRFVGESVRDKMTPVPEREVERLFTEIAQKVTDILMRDYDFYYEENAYSWALSHRYEIIELAQMGWDIKDIVHKVMMGFDKDPDQYDNDEESQNDD